MTTEFFHTLLSNLSPTSSGISFQFLREIFKSQDPRLTYSNSVDVVSLLSLFPHKTYE
jgi:hypothetical protein